MKKRNIAFLFGFFLDGGTETVLIEYLRNLSKTGKYNLTLVICYDMGDLEVFRSRIPEDVKVVHLVKNRLLLQRFLQKLKRPYKLLDELFLNPFRRLIIQRKLLKIGRENDVVIDFVNYFGSYMKPLECRKLIFYHCSLRANEKVMPRVVRHLQKRSCNYDHLITISQDMFEEAKIYFPNEKDRLCLIYNSINTEALDAAANAPVTDGRIEKPFILSVGRLEEGQKDVTTLIKAYTLLRKKYGHTEELYVIGKGESLGQLQQTARDCGVEKHVVFLGFMANPLPWTKRCSLFVQSSHFEGLPTTMLEALLLDKMVVASDCPTGPKEILNHGKAGVLVPMRDAEALAKAMHEALTDKELQARIAKGRNEHSRQFTFEVTGEQFMKLLDK